MAEHTATTQDFIELEAVLTKLAKATGLNPHEITGRYYHSNPANRSCELNTNTLYSQFPQLKNGGVLINNI